MSDETTRQTSSRIIPVDLEDEMRRSYLDYSMSVIVSRALPDVRDGLKPVHRRILFSMYEQKLSHQRPYKKSAAVVGDVLGKYHPHGDSAVYDSMVRMAQSFSLRHPLIDGQGNFGSVDGDPAAAYRYTEARMARIGEEMLRDIDRETVSFAPNFDSRLTEPEVLPAGFPNLLVNGASGIAVGMATNIPPHNLREIVEACKLLVRNPDATIEDLMQVVSGPDFPTGGIILGRAGIRDAYTTGQGAIVVRGRTQVEKTERGREAIIVTEIPYQVNKATLIASMAELVKQRKLLEISDIRDESDREGMRIVIELKREAMADIVLNQLYRHTELETSFGANMLALVSNTPQKLDLASLLRYYVEHRHDVVLRRSVFDLSRAEERAHIVEGLIKALDVIDEVLVAIRGAADAEQARKALCEGFAFTEKQAQAILDMRLHRLTALERGELEAEYGELREEIARLNSLVGSRDRRMEVVVQELDAVADSFGEPRRTAIDMLSSADLEIEDLVPDDPMVIIVSQAGYIKRLPVDTWRSQRRGGKGVTGATTREEDSLEQVFVATNHSSILFFTDLGFCHWLKVFRIPEESRQSKGRAIANLLQFSPGERPVARVVVKDFAEGGFIMMAASDGTVKKTPMSDYSRPRKKGIRAVKLPEGARLITASRTSGSDEILLTTLRGRTIRFPERGVRTTGRYTSGVRGIRVGKDDGLVGMVVLSGEGDILTVTANGFGKRTPVKDYRTTARGGKGIIGIRENERNGSVVAVRQSLEGQQLILVSARGMVIRLPVSDVRLCGRNTLGVRLMNLPEDDRLVDAAVFESDEGDIEEQEQEQEQEQTRD
jgi:DNA gyrase subunit A